MIFNIETRELISSTGYIKSKLTQDIYDHPIYLGIVDSESNYEESTEEEYQQYIEKLDTQEEE